MDDKMQTDAGLTGLIADYAKETITLAKVEKALEVTKAKRSSLVKAVFEKAGKGPHELGDGRGPCMIVQKGDTYFFTPIQKKKAVPTPAQSAGNLPDGSAITNE